MGRQAGRESKADPSEENPTVMIEFHYDGSLAGGSVTPRDKLSRPLHDLRISVTDRCNFRCVYCMPREVFGGDYAFLPREQLLTFEEIHRVARIFVGLGVRKIRITGGEPLIRRQVERLVAMLDSDLDVELTMTSNGSLLLEKAQALKDAGLDRISISLDSLDDEVFGAMNDVRFPVARVLAGVEAAVQAGLTPIKINMVVKRGVNEDSILPMAQYFRERGRTLRFIEYMDVGTTNGWRMDDVVPAKEILSIIDATFPIEPLDENYRGEVVNRYRYKDGAGEIGVIASVTQPFCGDCTRIRISAEGSLYTCLFATQGFDIKGLLRSGAGDGDIERAIVGVWSKRKDRYSEIRSEESADLPKVEMSYLGG
jgi:cyclic pyranopterin phosphate synthase